MSKYHARKSSMQCAIKRAIHQLLPGFAQAATPARTRHRTSKLPASGRSHKFHGELFSPASASAAEQPACMMTSARCLRTYPWHAVDDGWHRVLHVANYWRRCLLRTHTSNGRSIRKKCDQTPERFSHLRLAQACPQPSSIFYFEAAGKYYVVVFPAALTSLLLLLRCPIHQG